MFTTIIGWMFPPVLPGKVRDWSERATPEFHEQGWAGNKKRVYRDGIERHFAEQTLAEQLTEQMRINMMLDAAAYGDTETLQKLTLMGPPKKA